MSVSTSRAFVLEIIGKLMKRNAAAIIHLRTRRILNPILRFNPTFASSSFQLGFGWELEFGCGAISRVAEHSLASAPSSPDLMIDFLFVLYIDIFFDGLLPVILMQSWSM